MPIPGIAACLPLRELALLAGSALAAAGVALVAVAVTRNVDARSEPLRLALRIRRFIRGIVLAMLGTGLALDRPFLVVAALVIGFEETLETGIVIWALRHDSAS